MNYLSSMNARRIVGPIALLAISAASMLPLDARAQSEELDGPFLGVGFGQDMGGVFGFGLAYWPAPWLGGFVGGGWALQGSGIKQASTSGSQRPSVHRRSLR